MKKILSTLLLVSLLVGCSAKMTPIQYTNSAELTTAKADMSGYLLLEDTDHLFSKLSMEQAMKFFDEKGTGIIYLGYAECPWCNRAVPVLNDVAHIAQAPVYYIDVTDSINDDFQEDFVSGYLSSVLTDGKLYVPLVIAVKDGEIVSSHLSVLSDYDDYTKDMTDAQIKKLKTVYYDMFKQLQ